MASPIPPAKKDDPEDVSWALTTAETQWSRGEKAEALKWLRRAVDAASDAEDDMRALELAKAAAEVANAVGAVGPPPLPSSAPARKSIPPAAAAATRKSVPPPGKSVPPKGPAPRPAAGAPAKPTAVKVAAPVASKPLVGKSAPPPPKPKDATKEEATKEENRKTARRSYAGEVQRGRSDDRESTKTNTSEMRFSGTSPAATDKLREPMPTKPPEAGATSAADADAWPTETLAGDDLPMPNFEQERTRIGAAQYRADKTDERALKGPGVQPLQAVRVMLFRGADGALRVVPAGSDVSAVSIEAMLVSLDPEVDLPSWLS